MQVTEAQANNFWSHFPEGALTPDEVWAVAALARDDDVTYFLNDQHVVRETFGETTPSGRPIDAFAGELALIAT